MKFVRYTVTNEEAVRNGILSGEVIEEISGDRYQAWTYTGEHHAKDEVKLLVPLQPNQIIGIGANFVADRKDLPDQPPEMPVFFFKSLSSVTGTGTEIEIPDSIEEVKFEAEIAVVIGKEAKFLKEEEVYDHVFGYTIGNDVTAPQYFHEDGHWTLGKSFDTFTPLGPVIETDFDPSTAKIEAIHNGTKKQDSQTDLMIVTIQQMIAYLSQVMTLKPGDVILTGSPVGAEFLKEKDSIVCRIEGIGSLENSVTKVRRSAVVNNQG